MSKRYYKSKLNQKKAVKVFAGLILVIGLIITGYIFFPLISWQIYFAPVFASSSFSSPIPKTTIVSDSTIASLIKSSNIFSTLDYTNAQNWFPSYHPNSDKLNVETYSISIPKINLDEAFVSTKDYDLSSHLVNYGGTTTPPNKGTSVVFGHSTLPQLFNPNDYKTIFANLYKLEVGDEILATVNDVTYKYRIYSIEVVDAENAAVFEQNYTGSYLTLVTCTPPGTVWKRLVIRSKLEVI